MASEMHKLWTGGNEGFVSTWYLDPVHIPTIGFGFTWENDLFRNWWTAKYGRKFQKGDTISKSDALLLLGLILDRTTLPAVEQVMPRAAMNVKEAASDTAYNAGNGSLRWKWAQAFAAGDIKGGAKLLINTAVTGRGSKKRLPGLVRRRAEAAVLAERGTFPAWVISARAKPETVEETHLGDAEVREAQLILSELGYNPGTVDGIPGPKTTQAITQFQKDHGTLKVDGILGKATLVALVRCRDLKRKAGTTATTGSVTATTGGVAEGTNLGADTPVANADLTWVGDLLLWGGIALVVLGLLYLVWRYRYELPTLIRRLA